MTDYFTPQSHPNMTELERLAANMTMATIAQRRYGIDIRHLDNVSRLLVSHLASDALDMVAETSGVK